MWKSPYLNNDKISRLYSYTAYFVEGTKKIEKDKSKYDKPDY